MEAVWALITLAVLGLVLCLVAYVADSREKIKRLEERNRWLESECQWYEDENRRLEEESEALKLRQPPSFE